MELQSHVSAISDKYHNSGYSASGFVFMWIPEYTSIQVTEYI